jgi:hypothetical protein
MNLLSVALVSSAVWLLAPILIAAH